MCRGKKDARPDHQLVPSVVFSSPEVAVIGLTEHAAVEKHKNVDIYSSSFTCGPLLTLLSILSAARLVCETSPCHQTAVHGVRRICLLHEQHVTRLHSLMPDPFTLRCRPMKASVSDREVKALCKCIVDSKTDKVLGIHLVCPEASEILQAGAPPAGVASAQLLVAAAHITPQQLEASSMRLVHCFLTGVAWLRRALRLPSRRASPRRRWTPQWASIPRQRRSSAPCTSLSGGTRTAASTSRRQYRASSSCLPLVS